MTLFAHIDPRIAGQGPHRIALSKVIAACPPAFGTLGNTVRDLGDATQRMTRALGELGFLDPTLAEPGHDVHGRRTVGRDSNGY